MKVVAIYAAAGVVVTPAMYGPVFGAHARISVAYAKALVAEGELMAAKLFLEKSAAIIAASEAAWLAAEVAKKQREIKVLWDYIDVYLRIIHNS